MKPSDETICMSTFPSQFASSAPHPIKATAPLSFALVSHRSRVLRTQKLRSPPLRIVRSILLSLTLRLRNTAANYPTYLLPSPPPALAPKRRRLQTQKLIFPSPENPELSRGST